MVSIPLKYLSVSRTRRKPGKKIVSLTVEVEYMWYAEGSGRQRARAKERFLPRL